MTIQRTFTRLKTGLLHKLRHASRHALQHIDGLTSSADGVIVTVIQLAQWVSRTFPYCEGESTYDLKDLAPLR